MSITKNIQVSFINIDADCDIVYIIETDDEEVIEKLMRLQVKKKLTLEIEDSKLFAVLKRHYKDKIRVYKVEKYF
ncbi:hypothetical protein [Sulfurisphaera ohwakuensis]|uniref:hypothetical protein n=1 Tax=Sulfurisphaera ohwakuensis TaxID=69656 RepID=UPI0036F19C8D